MYIDIEGTDGCGKATQTKLLFDHLSKKGYKCKIISFPNYESKSSELVKMYLNGDFGDKSNCLNGYQASVLYAVDRLATMKKENLKDFDFVLFDRYTPSNMIHQSTNIKNEEDLDSFLNWLEEFEYGKLELPKPDVTLFLNVPVEISIKLKNERSVLNKSRNQDILEKDEEHLKFAYSRAKYVSKKFGWKEIDCTTNGKLKTIDQIHEDILTILGF